MPDEIIELLENEKLRSEVVGTIKKLYSYAVTTYDQNHSEEDPSEEELGALEEYGERHFWREAWYCTMDEGPDLGNVEKAFGKYVFDKMQQPYRISPEEILEHFRSIFYPGKTSCRNMANIDFESLYTAFVAYLGFHIVQPRKSDDFPVCRVPEEYIANNDDGGEVSAYACELALEFGEITEDMFWDKNGVNVHLRSASWRFPGKRHSYLTGYVSGRMSDPACSKFKTEIECILRSVVRSIAKIDPIDIDDEGEMNMPLRFGKDTMLIKGDTFEDNKVLIKKCLDVYYGISGKNNSIERRIANAVRLLVESDAQSNDAIGLALSVAGIEALLGEQGSEMVEKISTNAATLLEPDLEKRNDAAKYVKNIYDIRSRTLHGSEVEAKSSDRIQARILAAGVFVSMNSYADCMKRSGCEAKNLGELLEGIRDLRFKGGQPVGVIQCPAVRALWTK